MNQNFELNVTIALICIGLFCVILLIFLCFVLVETLHQRQRMDELLSDTHEVSFITRTNAFPTRHFLTFKRKAHESKIRNRNDAF